MILFKINCLELWHNDNQLIYYLYNFNQNFYYSNLIVLFSIRVSIHVSARQVVTCQYSSSIHVIVHFLVYIFYKLRSPKNMELQAIAHSGRADFVHIYSLSIKFNFLVKHDHKTKIKFFAKIILQTNIDFKVALS